MRVSASDLSCVLDATVRSLCPMVANLVAGQTVEAMGEAALRKELVGCILGSQVRYEMAHSATQNLINAGLLEDCVWSLPELGTFEADVFAVLCGRWCAANPIPSYRFPKIRSRQIAQSRDTLALTPITSFLSSERSPKSLRRRLATTIPGLGPKQASMFLRNVGFTYELAVLDTHVIRYIALQGMASETIASIQTLEAYERVEDTVVSYAASVGYPAGLIDRAIWATMKAAGELGL
jgi:N-glycosylase/DNA lyase